MTSGQEYKRRAVAGIQARMGSSRLPGKTLADLAGVPMLQRVCDRVRAARRLEAVVVLTSTDPLDDPIADYCRTHDIPCRRGPEQDVMARYLALLDEFDPRYVVRITGDCPFICPEHIDAQLEAMEACDADFAPAAQSEHIYLGQGAISARALRAASSSTDPADREHVGSFYFAHHARDFVDAPLAVEVFPGTEGLRLCVDEAPDLAVAREVYEALAPRYGSLIPLDQVLRSLVSSVRAREAARSVSHSADNRRLSSLKHRGEPSVPEWTEERSRA